MVLSPVSLIDKKIPKLLSGIITLTATASIALLIMGLANNEGIFKPQVSFTISYNGPQQTIYSLFFPWQYNEAVGMYITPSLWGDIIKSDSCIFFSASEIKPFSNMVKF